MGLGLAGTHRTGKTTLAKAVAEKLGLPFLQSEVAGVLDDMGISADQQMDFRTRMKAQFAILEHHSKLWRESPTFVADRTPLCFMMYTLSDIQPQGWDQSVLEDYVESCFQVANRHFSTIVLLQPGIPVVKASKNTGRLSEALMFKQNYLAKGLLSDERLLAKASFIRESLIDLESRVDAVSAMYAEDRKLAAIFSTQQILH